MGRGQSPGKVGSGNRVGGAWPRGAGTGSENKQQKQGCKDPEGKGIRLGKGVIVKHEVSRTHRRDTLNDGRGHIG